MKKIFMMAIALMASTMTFAGDSDALKAIMKSKDYAEAAQLLKQNLAQLADNAEKAKAYNHLVDLAISKVTNETGTIAENQLAAQMGSDKVKAYDTLGLADGICNAIENAIECNKYDQLPDAKGRVKPKFAEKNAARIWAVRPNLVNIGQTEAGTGENRARVQQALAGLLLHASFGECPRGRVYGYLTGCEKQVACAYSLRIRAYCLGCVLCVDLFHNVLP